MKKSHIKFEVAVTVLFATAAIFFSCSGSANEKTEITMLFLPSSSEYPLPPDDWDFYKVIEDNLGIKLNLLRLPEDENEQDAMIEKAAKGNALPDIFMVNNKELESLVKRGKVACIDEMFEMMPVRTAKMYDESARANSTFGGKCYGLSQPGSVAKNEGILIREDWLTKLNLKTPVTTEDYIEVMRKFTYGDPDGNGKDDTFGFGAFIETTGIEEGLGRRFQPFFGAFGVPGTFNMTEKDFGLNIHKAGYFDALMFIKQMVDEGLIVPEWTTFKKEDFRNAWKNGRFGIMREQNAAWGLESGYKPFDEKFPEGNWIVINPPKGPNGFQSVGNYTQDYKIFAISKEAEENGKIEKIAELLEWMMTKAYHCVAYGKENVNFRFDENGNITLNGLENPELAYTKEKAAPYMQLRNLVFCNSDAELLTRYKTWTSKNGKKISPFIILKDMQSRPWTATIGAEKLPPPPPNLKKMYEEDIVDFVIGKKSLNRQNWEDWLSEFDRKGGTDWEKECFKFAKEHNLLTK